MSAVVSDHHSAVTTKLPFVVNPSRCLTICLFCGHATINLFFLYRHFPVFASSDSMLFPLLFSAYLSEEYHCMKDRESHTVYQKMPGRCEASCQILQRAHHEMLYLQMSRACMLLYHHSSSSHLIKGHAQKELKLPKSYNFCKLTSLRVLFMMQMRFLHTHFAIFYHSHLTFLLPPSILQMSRILWSELHEFQQDTNDSHETKGFLCGMLNYGISRKCYLPASILFPLHQQPEAYVMFPTSSLFLLITIISPLAGRTKTLFCMLISQIPFICFTVASDTFF